MWWWWIQASGVIVVRYSCQRHATFFFAPDNGVLSYILEEELSVEVRSIENKQYRLDSEGATFDGRDLFSPAAAWLTKGQTPGSYGPLVQNYVTLPKTEAKMENGKLVGKIMYIDHFGNVISNITPTDLETFQVRHQRRRSHAIQLRRHDDYRHQNPLCRRFALGST